MAAVVVVFCLLFLFAWTMNHVTEQHLKISGCLHKNGHVLHAHTSRTDVAEFLHWQCDDCPFQITLVELRALGKDRFWYTRGLKPYSKEFNAAETRVVHSLYDMNPSGYLGDRPEE